MDDDYYNFTINHSTIEDDIHIANIESLICLKAKAYLDLNECKNNGGHIDKKHIEKHKKDVLRLTAMLAPNDVFIVPDSLKVDIADFCKYVYNNIPNADFFKSIGLPKITGEQLVSQLKMNFLIE